MWKWKRDTFFGQFFFYILNLCLQKRLSTFVCHKIGLCIAFLLLFPFSIQPFSIENLFIYLLRILNWFFNNLETWLTISICINIGFSSQFLPLEGHDWKAQKSFRSKIDNKKLFTNIYKKTMYAFSIVK